MRRRIAILLVTLGLVAACGSSATATPAPSDVPTPVPTDIITESPAPSVVPGQSPKATVAPAAVKRYKVQKNDTMWGIAQKFGVTVAALKAANPKVNPTAMRTGTILVIPAK